MDTVPDRDPQETREWLDALDGVLAAEGPDRAHFLIEQLIDKARRSGAYLPFSGQHCVHQHDPRRQAADASRRFQHRAQDPQLRSVECDGNGRSREQEHQRRRPHRELRLGGDALRHRLQPFLARAVERARRRPRVRAGSFGARASTRARSCSAGSRPEQMDNFRQEVDGKGVSSYPHPWLMPDFWQFPTVSMGLGPLMAIYQARFMKYLQDRGLATTEGRKVWCFCGDGEMDEPESMGAIGMAARENLDNLIFVVNCNLQRLDGPGARQRQDHPGARERLPRRGLERDQGDLGPALGSAARARQERHPDAPDDGSASTASTRRSSRRTARTCASTSSTRPELKALVADYSDDDIWQLNRGGHDPFKVYAALSRGGQPQGPADRDPRQDDQGLRHGRGGRGAEHHASAEEDVARCDPQLPRPLPAFRSPTTSSTKCLT